MIYKYSISTLYYTWIIIHGCFIRNDNINSGYIRI